MFASGASEAPSQDGVRWLARWFASTCRFRARARNSRTRSRDDFLGLLDSSWSALSSSIRFRCFALYFLFIYDDIVKCYDIFFEKMFKMLFQSYLLTINGYYFERTRRDHSNEHSITTVGRPSQKLLSFKVAKSLESSGDFITPPLRTQGPRLLSASLIVKFHLCSIHRFY